jgi:hypothetical protein
MVRSVDKVFITFEPFLFLCQRSRVVSIGHSVRARSVCGLQIETLDH